MIKLSKRNYKLLLCAFTLVLIIFFCINNRNMSNEKTSYEITDYLKDMTIQQYEEFWKNEEQVSIYFEEEKITEIVLKEIDDECEHLWTLCGLRPGMEINSVQKHLNVDGIIMECYNMQWYATGIALEKAGIERLSWDPNDKITYVAALVNTEKIEDLQDYELSIEEKKYAFYDINKNVNIDIDYPVINLQGNENVEEDINKNIEKVVNSMLQNVDVSNTKNLTINVCYEIHNIESECISIEWVGEYCKDGKTTAIRKAITYSIREEGLLLKLTDLGNTKEEIASEISWRQNVDEMEIYEQIEDNYFNFYVTPLHIVVFIEHPETKEPIVTTIWR